MLPLGGSLPDSSSGSLKHFYILYSDVNDIDKFY